MPGERHHGLVMGHGADAHRVSVRRVLAFSSPRVTTQRRVTLHRAEPCARTTGWRCLGFASLLSGRGQAASRRLADTSARRKLCTEGLHVEYKRVSVL
jgi:hypothetical protein